jgi:hypothetical protein
MKVDSEKEYGSSLTPTKGEYKYRSKQGSRLYCKEADNYKLTSKYPYVAGNVMFSYTIAVLLLIQFIFF